jgi:hypothetical protein
MECSVALAVAETMPAAAVLLYRSWLTFTIKLPCYTSVISSQTIDKAAVVMISMGSRPAGGPALTPPTGHIHLAAVVPRSRVQA